MSARPLDYDEAAVVAMLAALLSCPQPKRVDSLAVVVKVVAEVMEADRG